MVNTLKVKARIVELGLKQEDIAKRMDIDYSTLNQKLNNNRRLYIDEVVELCDILNIHTSSELKEFFGLDFLFLTESCEKATKENLGGA